MYLYINLIHQHIMSIPISDLSIVIPCFNEAKCIDVLYRELSNVLSKIGLTYELLFIDDGSTDNSLDILIQLSKQDSSLKYLSFSRNMGHQKALKAGIDNAYGNAVIFMDGDMQHPPALIHTLISYWRDGYDVVNTVRKDDRQYGFTKRITSKLFYYLINQISETRIKRGGADFKLLDAKVIKVLRECQEESLFLRGMTAWCGFKQVWVEYQADSRYANVSKYSFSKMLSLAIDGITSFSIRPLRVSILLSVVFALCSLIEIVYVLYVVLFTDQFVSGWASLAILISILGASILLMLGIIGEYIGKIFIQLKQRPNYIIKTQNFNTIKS